MSDDKLLPFDLPSVRRKKLTVDFAGGNQSSDGGLLLLREAERRLGVCRRLAEAMPDRRDPDRVRHAMFELVMARASAIAYGYEDAARVSFGRSFSGSKKTEWRISSFSGSASPQAKARSFRIGPGGADQKPVGVAGDLKRRDFERGG